MTFKKIDAISATAGPGLLGGLLVGVVAGKTLAHYLNKPFIAVNHLEGHALSIKLEREIKSETQGLCICFLNNGSVILLAK